MEIIHFYHTNDLHSHLSKWPRISNFLQEERQRITAKGEHFFAFDIGDACDRVHPLIEATDGKAMTSLLNEAGYDAATIGNNEGIGNSKEQLNSLYQKADFPVLISNMFDIKTGAYPSHTKPFHLLKTKAGHKIGLFALTAPYPLSYVPNGWQIKDPLETITEMLEILDPLVDSIVLLSHLGLNYDRQIANLFPKIKVIMGSHTHHLLPQGEEVRNTLLGAAGKYGEYVGHMVLEVEGERIMSMKAEVFPTEELPAPKNEEERIAAYLALGHDLLHQQEVADLPKEMPLHWQGTSDLVQAGLEAVKDYAKTDAAILNAGLFMEPLHKGIVTKDDLHQTLPHPMRILRSTLSGEDLVRLVQEMEKNRGYLRKFPIRGMGFRGELFGELNYAGIHYDSESQEVTWQGSPIEPERKYTFATVDHLMYVPFFPTIELRGENELLFPLFIRNVLGQYLKKNYPIKKQ